jgi:hypothetical protein
VITHLGQLADNEVATTSAHEYLGLRQLLEKEKSNISSDFSEALREIVDLSFEGRRDEALEAENWALVDETSIEHDIAVQGLEKSLSLKSNDAVNRLNEQLAKILSEDSIGPEQNPFSTKVICDALVKVLEKRIPAVARRTLAVRLLSRAQNLDVPAIYADLSRLLEDGGYKPNKGNFRVNRRRDKEHELPSQTFDALLAQPERSQAFLQALLSRVHGSQTMLSHVNLQPQLSAAQLAEGDAFPAIQFQTEALANHNAASLLAATGSDTDPVHMLSHLLTGQSSNYAQGQGQSGEAAVALGANPLPQISQPLLHNLYQAQATHARLVQGQEEASDQSLSPVTTAGQYQNIIRQTASRIPAEEQPNVLDATIIELVAMLFDFVFSNQQLADEIKAMLARLQLPMVRAAMIDRAFFSSRTHPARLMLNRLSEIGQHWTTDDGKQDASYQLIEQTVNQLLLEFDQDLSVFNRLLIQLESFTETERQEAAPNIEELVSSVSAEDDKKQQKVELARLMRERLDSRPLPNFVLDFLSKHWIRHLEMCVELYGLDAEATQTALTTVDELLTTMQVSVGGDDRRGLIKTLPQLIQKLKAGCDQIGLAETDKRWFFDQMFEFHARLLKGQATLLPTDSEGQSDYILDPETDQELGESDVFHDIVENIERGSWIELEDDIGKLQLAKLSWISPKRTTFLFTTRSGRKAASFSPLELATAFRTDKARILESEPLVDRAMAHIMGQLLPETS